jgi:hypothetical protein
MTVRRSTGCASETLTYSLEKVERPASDMQQHAIVFQESKHWETAGTAQRRWMQPCDCRLARAVKRSAPCAETDELRNKTSSVIKCLRHLSEPQMKSGSKKLKDQNRWQLWLFIAANAVSVLGNDRASGFKAALAGMAKLLPCGVADDVRPIRCALPGKSGMGSIDIGLVLRVLNSSKIWKTPSWSSLSTKRFRQTVALGVPAAVEQRGGKC